ncbi:MAG: cytochrome-c peroxidase, partial [Flavobacterium sp.]
MVTITEINSLTGSRKLIQFSTSFFLITMRNSLVLYKNILIFSLAFILMACSKEEDAYEDINLPINFEKPSNFPDLAYTFPNNPLTEKGFELGRKLFFDGRLSRTGIVSCNFCHEQPFAFTHHGHDLSHGV